MVAGPAEVAITLTIRILSVTGGLQQGILKAFRPSALPG
jgi:hypothetical protein